MPKEIESPAWFIALSTFIAICVGIAIWTGISYFEAEAYNRLTGHNVSTWDAMFLELRVQSDVKE